MKKLLYLLPLLVAGCARTVYVPQVSYYREVDTLVRQVADSSVTRALLECDSNNRVVMRLLEQSVGKTADQDMNFDSLGALEVRTHWRTKIVERLIERCDTVVITEVRTVEKQVRHVPRFFLVATAVAALMVGIRVWRILRTVASAGRQ